MKVADLEGVMIDYWVAKSEGLEVDFRYARYVPVNGQPIEGRPYHAYVTEYGWAAYPDGFPQVYEPSQEWAHGGPIIQREGFGIVKFYEPVDGSVPAGSEWGALNLDVSRKMFGPTPLVAAMRLHVANHYGDEVEDAPVVAKEGV